MDNRDRIMTEVLVNLNTIVRILKSQRNALELPCTCRMIADWESLARKICSASPENFLLRQCLLKMSERKSFFALEEEPLYWVLNEIIYKDVKALEKLSATGLYRVLSEKADDMKIKDFSERYKNPRSLGRRLSHLRPELEREFKMVVDSPRKGVNDYTFGPLVEEVESVEEVPPEAKPAASATARDAEEIARSEGAWEDLEELKRLDGEKSSKCEDDKKS